MLPPAVADRLRTFLASGELPEGWVCRDTIRLFSHGLAATVWAGGQRTLAALMSALRSLGAGILPGGRARTGLLTDRLTSERV